MRRGLCVLIVILGGCGALTDADPSLGRCAEPTAAWWPLDQGNRWVYDEIKFDVGPEDARKELVIQRAPAMVMGLAGEQQGVRAWRNERDGTGWRWLIDEGSGVSFRRDVWLGHTGVEAPCNELGPDEDVRGCTDVSPVEDKYYLPQKKRLDYRPDRVCEKSAWEETYSDWSIEIGAPDATHPDRCPLEVWRQDADGAGCPVSSTATQTNQWSVVFIGRRIEVPAGAFEHTLCVRRRDTTNPGDMRDVTYCFAQGIGKVYELDAGTQVECLTEYCLAGTPCEPAAPTGYPCDRDELED